MSGTANGNRNEVSDVATSSDSEESTMSGWDLAVIERLERLACLSLTEAERVALGADLEKIVTAAERLAQLDLSEFTPMTHAMELADVLRADACVPCSSVEAALANAPDYAGGYYRVPRVLES